MFWFRVVVQFEVGVAYSGVSRELSKTIQILLAELEYTPFMAAKLIRILTTEPDGDDGLIVTFSDRTTGAYVVEELLQLRPIRERVKTKNPPKASKVKARR
jgi:hypothetical protein